MHIYEDHRISKELNALIFTLFNASVSSFRGYQLATLRIPLINCPIILCQHPENFRFILASQLDDWIFEDQSSAIRFLVAEGQKPNEILSQDVVTIVNELYGRANVHKLVDQTSVGVQDVT